MNQVNLIEKRKKLINKLIRKKWDIPKTLPIIKIEKFHRTNIKTLKEVKNLKELLDGKLHSLTIYIFLNVIFFVLKIFLIRNLLKNYQVHIIIVKN
jgi:hypothetical protein